MAQRGMVCPPKRGGINQLQEVVVMRLTKSARWGARMLMYACDISEAQNEDEE